MRLKCYALHPNPPRLIPARPERAWMEAFPSRHAYRCLPLTIANSHGWEILSPTAFSIHWSGGPAAEDIRFTAQEQFPYLEHFVASNFTHGIVTLHTGYLFRTEPGWDLLATGPLNQPKDGIAPLTGVVETDWLPYPFTMNWHLTRPGVVRFQKDEPFCVVFPVPKGALEAVQPEILALEADHELHAQYLAWRDKREEFMAKFRAGDQETFKQAWQRYYFKGEYPTAGRQGVQGHRTKLRLAPPVDARRPDG